MVIFDLCSDIPDSYFPTIYNDRLALAQCPICGHFTSNIKKKATSFIIRDNTISFKCFYCNNGGIKHATSAVLKKLNIYDKYKSYLYKKDDLEDINYNTILKTKYSFSQIVPVKDTILKDIKDIEIGSNAYNFLKSRGLESFYKSFKSYQNKNLLYPFYYNNEICAGRFRILPQTNEKKILSLEADEASNYFSFFRESNISVNKPIYVFEGVEDSLSCGKSNSIAIFGLVYEKAIRLFPHSDLIFCFDKDKSGINTMKKIYDKFKDRYYFIGYTSEFGNFKDFNERLLAGYSFLDNADYIDRHIIKNPHAFYKSL